MTAPGSQLLSLFFSLGIAVPSSYLAGRVHQWYTHSLRRDAAFRQGYDHASRSMFKRAVRYQAATPASTVTDGAPRPTEAPRTVRIGARLPE